MYKMKFPEVDNSKLKTLDEYLAAYGEIDPNDPSLEVRISQYKDEGIVLKFGKNRRYSGSDWLAYRCCFDTVFYLNKELKLYQIYKDVVEDVDLFAQGQRLKFDNIELIMNDTNRKQFLDVINTVY